MILCWLRRRGIVVVMSLGVMRRINGGLLRLGRPPLLPYHRQNVSRYLIVNNGNVIGESWASFEGADLRTVTDEVLY